VKQLARGELRSQADLAALFYFLPLSPWLDSGQRDGVAALSA
jgi:hypothetical protein